MPAPRFVAGACGVAVFAVGSNIGHMALLAVRLPAAAQARAVALASACGQLGRCVAPLAAAATYATYRHNGLFLYLLLSVGAAHAVPLLRMRHMYGGLRDPSRHAQLIAQRRLGGRWEAARKQELM